MGRLKKLRDMGFTVIVLHHTPKCNDQIYKGSTVIIDLADHVLSFYEERNVNSDARLDNDSPMNRIYRLGTKDKTRYEPVYIFLTFISEKGFMAAPDPDTDNIEAIHQLLEKSGPLNQSQIFEQAKDMLGIRRKERFINLMKKGEGKYWKTQKNGRALIYYLLTNCLPISK